MPALTRWTNMGLLDEERPAGARWPPRWPPVRTLLVVTAHGLMGLSHLSHLLLRSKGDRVYNDAGAFIAAQTTWSYLLQALLQRRTLRRLYAEMLEYSRFVESRSPAGSGPLPLPASRLRLRRLWTTQTALTLGTWAFYTASPFLFEFIHDIDLGSLRRLSAMTHPTLCDLRGLACYIVTYVVVAFEWFLASFAFSSVESTNLVFYTVASKHFEHLGASIGQVFSGDDAQAEEKEVEQASRALRLCVQQHQFLLRWSKEMTAVYAVPTFIRLGAMVLLFILPLLKVTTVDNYVMDELPFVGLYGVLTIYAVCWFADDLNRAVLNRSYSALQTIRAARRKGADQT
ncbi:uncharacterized protein LOC127750248 isoform X2 [Frankliniella occidentalis]|uniref:Uncharacterized protein LOC127750248 isoform X2 n=1 Tax=Frankliniella occidentalis TaxID=133901 RepID=A0A9C6X1D1_FRAOC|nr:uncharacterized protein LOC127750248 isoform X2 [Frankliniella occidentalis]